jgi:hypothetical protein
MYLTNPETTNDTTTQRDRLDSRMALAEAAFVDWYGENLSSLRDGGYGEISDLVLNVLAIWGIDARSASEMPKSA